MHDATTLYCAHQQASRGFHPVAFKEILELECSRRWSPQKPPWYYIHGAHQRDCITFTLSTGDLAKAVKKKETLKFGLYHSLYEWYNPLYLEDKANNFTTQYYIKVRPLISVIHVYRNESSFGFFFNVCTCISMAV